MFRLRCLLATFRFFSKDNKSGIEKYGCSTILQHIEAGERCLKGKAEVTAFTRCRESETRKRVNRDGG